MHSIDVAYRYSAMVSLSLCVCMSICALGTPVSPAKATELSRCHLWEGQTYVGQRNHILDGVHIDASWQI